MRLLEIKGPSEFSLVQVATHNTLPYAILSHTWTHDQEVTYKDLISGTGKGKTGYEKIKFCGEQATKDGLQYFWVDTCCIDKSDSTELTTAINSMFRWYRNAKKCYVYLADVSTPGHDADVQANQSTWEAAFRGSKWFTRGWTLQELIAPAIVEFFSKEGERLGDKKSLEKPVHEITRIPIQALQGNPFSDFSIDERKEWAVQRQTTEEEDMIYCLLGLYEVSMPPIYGEGKEAALKRLQMTIREFSEDSSKTKDLKDNVIPFVVPFDRNPNFTGRGIQLAGVEEKLFREGGTAKVAIWGLGGIGKTQLVLELVYRIRDKHENCAVIWIPAMNMESLYQTYLDIAQQLRIPAREDKEADVKKLVQEHLSKHNAGKWLLVFDNADDINMWIAKPGSGSGFAQGSGGLIEYLPRSKQGFIVFTTRDRKIAVKLANENIVKVPEMNEDEATKLLQKRLVDSNLVNNKPDMYTLLKELTYLPLAIVQAAAYINENGIPFAKYLSLLADQEENVIELLSEEFEDDGRYLNGKNPVVTTWLVSFEQIRHRDPLAAQYLSFIACLDPKGIPQSLLPAGVSRKKETDAIGMLDAYSFITRRSANLAFDLHRLVHLATRNWLRKEELITQWSEKAITRLEEVFPDCDYRNRSVWRTYLPHASFVLQSNLVDKFGENRFSLAWKFGVCLYGDGRFDESEIIFAEVVAICKIMLGPEHPDTLFSINIRAGALQQKGMYNEAETIYWQTLKLREKVLGKEHPDTLISMNNLALALLHQGMYNKAETIYRQTLKLMEKVLGKEHPYTLTSINNLGRALQDQGKYNEAELIFRQMLELQDKVLGKEHPNTLTSMNNLALILASQGKYAEAETLNRQTLELREEVLDKNHPDTLTTMNNLAGALRHQGKHNEAEPICRQTLKLMEKVLGKEHPNTIISINNLGKVLQSQGKYNKAEPIFWQTLELSKKILGKEHPDTLISMNDLAGVLQDQGKYNEAETIYRQTLKLMEKVLGKEHPNILTSMGNFAGTLKHQGKYNNAETIYRQTLKLKEKILGKEHPNTLTSMNDLGGALLHQNMYNKAETIYWQTLKLREKVLGKEHPDTLISMNNLALALRDQGKYNEAETIYRQTLKLMEKVLGKEHPNILTSMDNFAGALYYQGKYNEAETIYWQTLKLKEKVLGKEHPDTLISMSNLAKALQDQGKHNEAEPIYRQTLKLMEKVLGKEHPNTLTSINNLALALQAQGKYNEAKIILPADAQG